MHKNTNIICKSLVIATFGLFLTPAMPSRAEAAASTLAVPPAQTYKIKGTVVDELNEPLPGATVFVKGTKNGTDRKSVV